MGSIDVSAFAIVCPPSMPAERTPIGVLRGTLAGEVGGLVNGFSLSVPHRDAWQH
jgi:hypothetical protein